MRAVLLLVVVAVLALGSWWLLRAEPGVAPMPTMPSSSLVEKPAAAITGSEPAATGDVARESAMKGYEGSGTPIPPDAQWIEVLVVDKANQQPAPDVEVLWTNDTFAPQRSLLTREQRNELFVDREANVERFCWRARTDSTGKVRVSLEHDRAEVIARDGRRYGHREFHVDPQLPPATHRLEIEADLTLRVHVTDATGMDVEHVRVGVLAHDPADTKPLNWLHTDLRFTDARGMVV